MLTLKCREAQQFLWCQKRRLPHALVRDIAVFLWLMAKIPFSLSYTAFGKNNCGKDTYHHLAATSRQCLHNQSNENRDVLDECVARSFLLISNKLMPFRTLKLAMNHYFCLKNENLIKFQHFFRVYIRAYFIQAELFGINQIKMIRSSASRSLLLIQ